MSARRGRARGGQSESGRMLYETARPMHFDGGGNEYAAGYDAIDWGSGPSWKPKCRQCGEPAKNAAGETLYEGGDSGRQHACEQHGGAPSKRVDARTAKYGKFITRLL